MSTAAQQIATRHFGKRTVAKLARLGVVFLGTQALPNNGHQMPYADADIGYIVNDNGTGRVLTYADVKRMEA